MKALKDENHGVVCILHEVGELIGLKRVDDTVVDVCVDGNSNEESDDVEQSENQNGDKQNRTCGNESDKSQNVITSENMSIISDKLEEIIFLFDNLDNAVDVIVTDSSEIFLEILERDDLPVCYEHVLFVLKSIANNVQKRM